MNLGPSLVDDDRQDELVMLDNHWPHVALGLVGQCRISLKETLGALIVRYVQDLVKDESFGAERKVNWMADTEEKHVFELRWIGQLFSK